MKTGLVSTLIDMISVLYVFAKSYPHSMIVVLFIFNEIVLNCSEVDDLVIIIYSLTACAVYIL